MFARFEAVRPGSPDASLTEDAATDVALHPAGIVTANAVFVAAVSAFHV